MRIVVGVTGASGAMLALETIARLRSSGADVHLVISAAGRISAEHEIGRAGLDRMIGLATARYEVGDIAAPIASGSFRTDAMAIVPCSMRSLAALAHGLSDNLITRAGDVMLKERRRLVLVPREAPLHEVHLASMLTLARMGAVIAPPVPPFYTRPTSLADLVGEMAARIVGWLGVDPGAGMTRWSGLVRDGIAPPENPAES